MSEKFKVFTVGALFASFVVGCATRSTKKATPKEAGQEIRLKEDRQKFEEVRKNIPAETREFNDESSLILNLFSDQTKSPSDIQSKFYTLTNRKRDDYSKQERRRREDYSEAERRKRENFSEQARRERENSKIDKMSKDDRTRFFSEQDLQRRRFYADESDDRRNFEAKLREERQDFDAHLRDMRSRFDNEYRNYIKTYNERKKLDADSPNYGRTTRQKSFSSGAVPPGFTAEDMKDLDSIPTGTKPLTPSSDSE